MRRGLRLLDDRGRLFGRWNVIDLLVAGGVLLLIPLGYGAFVLFRTPTPTITAIDAAELASGGPGTVRITGTNLRPYLRARVGTFTGTLLVASPMAGEVKVDSLPPGTYDFVLLEEARELLRLPAALTVPPLTRTRVTLRVRFFVWPEVIPLLKAGDVDLGDPAGVTGIDRATLVSLDASRQRVTATTRTNSLEIQEAVTALDATVLVSAMPAGLGLQYKNRPLKAGALFSFDGLLYAIDGWILNMQVEASGHVETR